MVIFDNF